MANGDRGVFGFGGKGREGPEGKEREGWGKRVERGNKIRKKNGMKE